MLFYSLLQILHNQCTENIRFNTCLFANREPSEPGGLWGVGWRAQWAWMDCFKLWHMKAGVNTKSGKEFEFQCCWTEYFVYFKGSDVTVWEFAVELSAITSVQESSQVRRAMMVSVSLILGCGSEQSSLLWVQARWQCSRWCCMDGTVSSSSVDGNDGGW